MHRNREIQHNYCLIVPSRTILIKNFVRPLTLPAVKELLAESGTVEHFWMDKIKSHCFATYKNLDEAIQAVQHCHGLKFPSDTGRNLICEFMTREQADVSIAATEAKQQQRSAGNARGSGGGNALHPSWHVPRSRSGEADAAGVHGRQAQPQPVAAPRPEYNPPPVPNDAYPNDKIFNKTKALPPIYYMRLTDEEVRARERDAKDLERTKFERAEYNPRSGRGGSDTYAGRPQSTSHRFAPYAGRPRAPHKADRSSNWRARSPDRRGGGRPRSPAGRR
ncbi:hypothetical protein DFJ77DRAFT_466174 [Powellomyces hirtus]|nr:hypothetical protein DFJ77DRAFT_466174 [Powellomyces hirtus]